MQLTQRQEDFCNSYIETGSATEAYKRTYTANRMKPSTINRNAKEFIDHPGITARLTELRAPVVEKARLTLENHLRTLAELRDRAVANGSFGAAVQAEIARGKASGLYVEKLQVTPVLTPASILAEVKRRYRQAQGAPALHDGVIDADVIKEE